MHYNRLLQRATRKIFTKYVLPDANFIYSQSGEDLIMSHLFDKLSIFKPSYLDIGANEPKFISNTYLFYERGSRGVLIEPNPYLFKKLQKQRTRDTVLNFGIGLNEVSEADFYLFPDSANGLSTFSKEDAMYWQEVGMKDRGKIYFEEVIKVKLIPVNSVLEEYFSSRNVNLISLDVEGLDFEILKSIDFDKYQPEVICVETLKYDINHFEIKNQAIINYMKEVDYEVYADTRVNTIFCRSGLLNKTI